MHKVFGPVSLPKVKGFMNCKAQLASAAKLNLSSQTCTLWSDMNKNMLRNDLLIKKVNRRRMEIEPSLICSTLKTIEEQTYCCLDVKGEECSKCFQQGCFNICVMSNNAYHSNQRYIFRIKVG